MARKISILSLVLVLVAALCGPNMVAWGAINYPSVFGQLTGDCTTATAGSYATTCTKTNGTAFGTAATQNTGTSGSAIPTLSGANTWSAAQAFGAISATSETLTGALSGTTETLTGLMSGVANTFTGLSTQTGGHIVGVGDYTAAQTLVAANEDVSFTCTASCAATLPAGSNGLAITIQDLSTTAGYVVVTPVGTGTKVMTPTGPASTYTYQNLYQGAKWVYHSGPNLWIAE